MTTLNSQTFSFLNGEPAQAEPSAPERSPEARLKEFQREAWEKTGAILKIREIDGHLLAKIRVSEKMKAMAALVKGVEETGPSEQDGEALHIGNVREGVVLALKNGKPGFSVMGGKHADKLSPSDVDSLFLEIVSKKEFEATSDAIEGCLSESEERKCRLNK